MRSFLNLLVACALIMIAFAVHATEKRVALVVGNSAYPSGRLDNPKNDASAIAAAFTQLGFDVDLKTDASKADLDAAMKLFGNKADKADVAVLFYAGHGMAANGFNYLIPINAKPQSERDLKREMVKLDDAIDDMGNAKVKLVFFDACRDNPLARSFSRGGSRGLAAPAEATGTLISFATKHGNTAGDGEGEHSPYTEALLAALKNPTEEIHAMLRKQVQEAVKGKTGGKQEPWAYGNLNGDFYFIQGPVNVTVNPAALDPSALELGYWNGAVQANSEDAYKSYLAKYPKGQFADLARASLTKLQKTAPAAPVDPAVELSFWDSIKNRNDASDFEAYLRKFPKGNYKELAENRLRLIKPIPPDSPPSEQIVPVMPLPVQPPKPAPAAGLSGGYTDNGDGSVTHGKTGLRWKRCAEGMTWTGSTCAGESKEYIWKDAKALGVNGWRLPSIEELRTIVEKGNIPTINAAAFPNTPASHFWSASSYGEYSAWYVYFNNGDDGNYFKAHYYLYVRLVRGGQ